jgi:alanyl-tRNA synthetase
MICQRAESPFETDLFTPLIQALSKICQSAYPIEPSTKEEKKNQYAFRVIVDHIRAIVFAIADGVKPSNKQQGYVIRKLLRRSAVFGRLVLKINTPFLHLLVPEVVEKMKSNYPNLFIEEKNIISAILSEENQFAKTLTFGKEKLETLIRSGVEKVSAEEAFLLYESHGYPLELIIDLAKNYDLEVDVNGFQELVSAHQLRSQTNQKKITSM